MFICIIFYIIAIKRRKNKNVEYFKANPTQIETEMYILQNLTTIKQTFIMCPS